MHTMAHSRKEPRLWREGVKYKGYVRVLLEGVGVGGE